MASGNTRNLGIKAGNKRLKDYGKVLMAKQLLRAVYNNPSEKIFKRNFNKNTTSAFGKETVFKNLSSRLEIILTAIGGALSFKHARQIINHGKVSVNGYVNKQPNYLLKDGDIITSSAGLNFKIKNNKSLNNKSVNNNLDKNVGLVKTIKLPEYLGIKVPVAASFIINSDLNLAIYYSKPLFTYTKGNNQQTINSNSKSSRSTITTEIGWKNLSVKQLKLLVAPISKDLDIEKNQLDNSLISLNLTELEQNNWTNLYSLVQAYYLRK